MGDDETILKQNAPLAEDVIAIRPHDQTVTTKSLEETTAVSNLTKNSDPDILLHFILMKKKKNKLAFGFLIAGRSLFLIIIIKHTTQLHVELFV